MDPTGFGLVSAWSKAWPGIGGFATQARVHHPNRGTRCSSRVGKRTTGGGQRGCSCAPRCLFLMPWAWDGRGGVWVDVPFFPGSGLGSLLRDRPEQGPWLEAFRGVVSLAVAFLLRRPPHG